MNPRIQELAEQCTAEGLFNDDSGLYTARINVEKFAQSILLECLDIIEHSEGDVDFAVWKIRHHFGVK